MKICFVGPGYNSLKGIPEGGSERQIALLAHYLSNLNHTVVFVATGSDVNEKRVGKVTVFSGWERGKGIKGLRFFSSYLPTLYNILIDINADLYYVRGFSLYAPVVVRVSNVLKSMSIVALASDSDLSTFDGSKIGSSFVRFFTSGRLPRWFFIEYALRKATVVAAQTKEQAAICAALKLRSIQISNAIELVDIDNYCDAINYDIAWIGHISLRKGFDTLLSLASELPMFSFCVVGDVVHESLRPALFQLSKLNNVTFYHSLSHMDVLHLIETSKIVINTSPLEGFSNVFLEAWLLRTPVVSLNANPNSLFSRSMAFGYCANGNLDMMIELIVTLLEDDTMRLRMGSYAREYVVANHSLASISLRIVDAYKEFCRKTVVVDKPCNSNE